MISAENPYASPAEVEDSGDAPQSVGIPEEILPTRIHVRDVIRLTDRIFRQNRKKCILGFFFFFLPALLCAEIGPLLFLIFSRWQEAIHLPAFSDAGLPIERMYLEGNVHGGFITFLFVVATVTGLLMGLWIFVGAIQFFTKIVRGEEVRYQEIYQAPIGEMFRMAGYWFFAVLVSFTPGYFFFFFFDQMAAGGYWPYGGWVVAAGKVVHSHFEVAMMICVFYALFLSLCFLPGFWLMAARQTSINETIHYSFSLAIRNSGPALRTVIWLFLVFLKMVIFTLGIGLIFYLPYVVLFYVVSCLLASGEKLE